MKLSAQRQAEEPYVENDYDSSYHQMYQTLYDASIASLWKQQKYSFIFSYVKEMKVETGYLNKRLAFASLHHHCERSYRVFVAFLQRICVTRHANPAATIVLSGQKNSQEGHDSRTQVPELIFYLNEVKTCNENVRIHSSDNKPKRIERDTNVRSEINWLQKLISIGYHTTTPNTGQTS